MQKREGRRDIGGVCLRAGECVGEPVKMCTIPEPGSGFYTTWKNSVSQTRSESFRTRCVGVPYSQPTRLKYLLCFYPTFLVSFFSFSLSFSCLIPFSSLSFFSSIHLLTSSSSSFFFPVSSFVGTPRHFYPLS